jgi:hypothetical protein
MFKDWLSGELRFWYVQSAHKKRVDFEGGCLQKLKYVPVVIRLHLHDWVRFVHYLEDQALPVPGSFRDPEVRRYLTRCASPRGVPADGAVSMRRSASSSTWMSTAGSPAV